MQYISGYVIDREGFWIDTVAINLENDEYEDRADVIREQPVGVFYKMKWNGNGWVEGATQAEIDEPTKVEPSPPTQAEILEQRLADLELMLAEILFN